MKLKKVVHLYFKKLLGKYTLEIMKKYLEIYQKFWKNHGNIMEFCQARKVGTLKKIATFSYLKQECIAVGCTLPAH